jgi:hypothetical protein
MIDVNKQSSRPHPRLSVNLLAKYSLAARVRTRARILRDAKFPDKSRPKIQYYEWAEPYARDFFANGFDDQILQQGMSDIEAKPESSDMVKHKKSNSIKALESLLGFDPKKLWNGSKLTFDAQKLNTKTIIPMENVHISARPEVLVKYNVKGEERIGALKFYFSSKEENKLTEEAGQLVGTVMYSYLEEAFPDDVIDNRLIHAVDIFQAHAIECPKAQKKRKELLNDCCTEIKGIWPLVQPSA